MAKQDDFLRITVRMPTQLHDKLSQSGEQSNRSLNAEVVARLQLTYQLEEQHRDELSFVWERITLMEDKLEQLAERLQEWQKSTKPGETD